MKIRKMLFGLMFVLFWVQNGVQAEPAQEFVLKNGMKVVVREDHRAPVVTHMVWYRVGSMDETSGTTGVAHVLEHMMFKGHEEVSRWEPLQDRRRIGREGQRLYQYGLHCLFSANPQSQS